jgi:dihydroflavonol-4-reductase
MIAITGCNGLLGSLICKTLVNDGHQVKALVREGADLSLIDSNVRPKIQICEIDFFDNASLDEVLKNVSTVIHCAARVSFAPSRVKEMYDFNVHATRQLVNACLHHEIQKFIHISSIAAIGRPINASVITEDILWEESPNNTHYARSKYLSELEVHRGFEEGLQGFILNPSVILAPGKLDMSSSKLFGYVKNGGRYTSEGDFNVVDGRDVVAILLLLWNRTDINGQRFIVNAGKLQYQDFFHQVASYFGVRPPNIKVHPFVLQILWRFEYVKSWLTGSEPLITKETARLTQTSHTYSSTKIVDLLQFQFRPLPQTISWVCEELRRS